jgi:hypothetical protein
MSEQVLITSQEIPESLSQHFFGWGAGGAGGGGLEKCNIHFGWPFWLIFVKQLTSSVLIEQKSKYRLKLFS